MDLSAYIAIAVTLNKVTGNIIIQDTSNYPVGVPPTILGCVLSILQPDGVSVGNSNFSSPDIAWTGSGLNQALYELRLNTVSTFQSGVYQITYAVEAPGYDQTTLIKTFTLNYTAPVPVITANLDNFTPNLSVSDGTNYVLSGFNLISINDTWSALITSVNGNPQTIGGTTNPFFLTVGGLSYDANYLVTMTALVSWTLASPSNFVTIVDQFQILNQNLDSETPPSTTALLAQLTFLKAQLDAAGCNCNTYSALLGSYLLAQAVYQHFLDRGCASDFANLSSYVYQMQALFNFGVTPPVSHTNNFIPAYVFPCSGGSGGPISWSSITGKPATVIIQWTVLASGGAFPINGANVLTDTRLAGFNVLILRDNIQELNYTKNLGDNFITFANPFSTGEVIYVQTIPL